jgi:uncharacterized protein (DUF952 family)
MILYHITERSTWDYAINYGVYKPKNFNLDGFIHCSTVDQVVSTANLFYRNSSDLVLLKIESGLASAQVVFENLEGGDQKFPHIYGPLNLDAVIAVATFEKDNQEIFHLPVF